MIRLALVASILVVLMPNVATAQEQRVDAGFTPNFHFDGFAEEITRAPFDRPFSAFSGAELRTVQDSSSASLRLASTTSFEDRFDSWSLTLATPINKAGPDTRLATLDGLTNATTLEVRFNRMQVFGRHVPTEAELRRADELCAEARLRVTGTAPTTSEPGCDPAFIEANARDLLPAFEALFWGENPRLLTWGASARGGYQEFNYFDGTTLERREAEENPWSASVFVGMAWPNDRRMVTLSYTQQNSFRDATVSVLCPGGVPPLTCVDGPIGPPNEKDEQIVAFEWRQGFDAERQPRLSNIGFALTASYDIESEEYGVDLPVYLVQSDARELTGGVRFGWRSDDNEITVGVFVSRAFSFMNLTR